ncbi:MAG TPA: choice-of-anchor Q domain-containing protein [Candidatus Dormibacteraeota bacterium]|jgi:hypothetical protein|nr:choice-of-anchor Q domain-containing protein [Candidatus Dormibacteraeota bacterium]
MKLQGKKLALLPLAPAAALLLALAGAGPVHATGTTINVTGLTDGVGSCVDATHCSTLRAAVAAAVDGDTVLLPAGTYTLSATGLDTNSIEINKAITVMGAGAASTVIQGVCDWTSRIFTVDTDAPAGGAAAPVTISGVTLTGGHVIARDPGDGFTSGGAVLVTDHSALTLSHDIVTGNQAIGNGGGVSVHKDNSSLTVLDTIISNNAAGSNVPCVRESPAAAPQIAQALVGDGGGVWSEGKLTMTSSSVGSNTASRNGGGLLLSPPAGTTDTLTQVYVHDNAAMASQQAVDIGGGGIYDELVTGAHVVIDHSTISHNLASGGNGGGDYESFSTKVDVAKVAVAVDTTPGVTITATTFKANSAPNGTGGALYVHDGANVLTTNDTMYGNSATNGGAIAIGQAKLTSKLALENDTIDGNSATAGQGGGLYLPDGMTTEHNTILVNNTATQQVAFTTVTHNCVWTGATLASLGWNLADDTTCNLTFTGDQLPPAAKPVLGTLQDNGGVLDGATGDTSPTLTQLLGKGSTALDMADPTTFPATDERDVTRAQAAPSALLLSVGSFVTAARADIGAVEMAAATSTPTPVIATPTPSPRSGVQGIISVPATGADPTQGFPLGGALAIAGLLSIATGAVLARRRS